MRIKFEIEICREKFQKKKIISWTIKCTENLYLEFHVQSVGIEVFKI